MKSDGLEKYKLLLNQVLFALERDWNKNLGEVQTWHKTFKAMSSVTFIVFNLPVQHLNPLTREDRKQSQL